jgi:hypothetical protein
MNTIEHKSRYRNSLPFGLTCIIYHATTAFCRRSGNSKNDPINTFSQMVSAARSARQNIVEASLRARTSKETEMRLLDAAKISLQELAEDFEAFINENGDAPWSERDQKYVKVKSFMFDDFSAREDLRHEYGKHLLAMRIRFAGALESEDLMIAANSILVTIERIADLLQKQIDEIEETLRRERNFADRRSKSHLETKEGQDTLENAPKCPKCGGAMRKVVAKKGANPGKPFWSCRDYPNCNGTRKWEGRV